MQAAVFALTNPVARAKSLKQKPDWWLTDAERFTRPHRKDRADRISDKGQQRSEEALFVRNTIRQALDDERGCGPLAKRRALPGGTPEIKKILRRWDTQIRQRTRGAARLLREVNELTSDYITRIFEECDRRIDSRWHAHRAKGQEERFKRVAECGKEERGILQCVHCKNQCADAAGNPLVLKKMCGAILLCHDCRQIKIKKNRKRFTLSRINALQRVRDARLGPGQVKSDPLVERFITLTCPHLTMEQSIMAKIENPDGTVSWKVLRGPDAQAYLVRNAWSRFWNSLRNRFKRKGNVHPGLDLISFVRVIEATTGRDELGHVHIHIWLLSPFLRVQIIRAMWGRALMKAGFPKEHWPEHAWMDKKAVVAELQAANDEVALTWARYQPQRLPYPMVHIKRVTPRGNSATVDGFDLGLELIKYLTKDIESGKNGAVFMSPWLFSAVYCGLDSGRLITASRKFWVKQHCECRACGAIDSLRPHAPPRPDVTRARGPPIPTLFDLLSTTCASA
ncbi:MAG TPA: hypothetical protein VE967_19355 [Gemmatimonadaceae bacterium]|nr:hypothetical protein [Gemmatimonadaceae bacterium]